MRFFVRLQDNPDAPKYMQPQSLHRFDAGDEMVTERYDRQGRKWVDNPNMLAFTGIGGATDFREVDEGSADALIAQWTHDKAPENPWSDPADTETQVEAEPQDSEAVGQMIAAIEELIPAMGIEEGEEGETEEVVTKGPMRRIIKRGSEKSGHYGHEGRPGEVGGSLPSGHAAVSPKVERPRRQVGLTSARPGKPARQVFTEMREFQRRLEEIESLRDVNVAPGLGGWEGGSEPTWIVSFTGNGEATRLIAETAKAHDQDGVLLMQECGGRQDCSPVVDFHFSDAVTPDERRAVEAILVANGLGGWTWYRRVGGHSSLRAVAVPQWGGEREAHMAAAERIRAMLTDAGMSHDFQTGEVAVSVMQREGEGSYDDYIRQ